MDAKTIQKACEKALEIFHTRINIIHKEVSKNNDAFVDRRLESLRTSYNKNLSRKREQLERALKDKKQQRYIRMLEGTIKRLGSELKEKEKSLEDQRTTGLEYEEISAGILEVI